MDYFAQLQQLQEQAVLYKNIIKYTTLSLIIIAFIGGIFILYIDGRKDKNSTLTKGLEDLRQEKINQLNFSVSLYKGTYLEKVEFAYSIINKDPILKGVNFIENIEKLKGSERNSIQKALALFISEEYESAAFAFKQILNNSDRITDLAIGNAYLGSIYLMNIGAFVDSPQEYLLEAERLFEMLEISDEDTHKIKALNYGDLGVLYKKKKDLQNSLKYYKKRIL